MINKNKMKNSAGFIHAPSLSKKSGAGFTLAELLVVTGIIVVLSAITLPAYRVGEKQFALERSSHKLAQDIRRTQEMAMSAKEFQGIIPVGGYGAYFVQNSNYYILFADCDNNKAYSSGTPCNGFSERVETLYLEKGVKLKRYCFSPPSIGNVVFTPPDPTVTFNPSLSKSCNDFKIQLFLEANPTETKAVMVGKAGLINVE